MKSPLQSYLSLMVLLLSLSSPSFAAEVPASCNAAQALNCPEVDVTVNTFLECTDRKLALIASCRGEMRKNIQAAQNEILNSIDSKAAEVTNGQDADLALLDLHLNALKKINDENLQRFNLIGRRFSSFVKEFETEVKPTIAAYADSYTIFAEEINKVTQANNYEGRLALQATEVDLQSTYNNQMIYIASVRSKLILVREEMLYFSADYLAQTKLHKEYLSSQGYEDLVFETEPYVDLLTKADNSLVAAIASINSARGKISDRILITTNSLVDQYVLKKTKKVMDDVNHLRASSDFLAQVNGMIRMAFVESTATAKGVPLFSKKYESLNKFISFAAICDTQVKSSWMTTGCSFASEKRVAAKKSLNQMPSNMQIGLSLIASKPEVSAQAEDVQHALKANDLGKATLIYDTMMKGVFP
jgi:hypothetical protein